MEIYVKRGFQCATSIGFSLTPPRSLLQTVGEAPSLPWLMGQYHRKPNQTNLQRRRETVKGKSTLLRAGVLSQGLEHPTSGGTAIAGTKWQESGWGEAFAIQRDDCARGRNGSQVKPPLSRPEHDSRGRSWHQVGFALLKRFFCFVLFLNRLACTCQGETINSV